MTVSQEQINRIVPLLARDRAYNFSQLQTYLKTILANRQVDFVSLDENGKEVIISLSPQDAWSVISKWGETPEANLPIGDAGSIKNLASRLLGYIETNIVGRTQEAVAARYAAIEQARNPIPPSSSPSPALDHFQKSQAKRREFFDALNTKFLGQLTSEYEKSKYIRMVRERTDPETASMVAALLAAASANLRKYETDKTGNTNLPNKINETLLPLTGNKGVNNAIHLAHSQAVQESKALEELVEINNRQIATSYQSDQAYIVDQEKFRDAISLSPTLNNISALIDHLAPSAPLSERQKMANLLRQEIVKSAHSQHQGGFDILSKAFYKAKLDGNPSDLSPLFPVIEEIEASTRHTILGVTLKEHDIRLLSTLKLAEDLGVNPTTPWLRQQDIGSIQKDLFGQSVQDPLAALEIEWKQPNPNIKRIVELNSLLNNREEYGLYHQQLSHHPLFSIRDFLAKTNGSFKATTEPISKLYQKTWAGIEKVDNVINWPTRTFFNWWENQVTKRPWLDPIGSAYKGWVNLQKNYASRLGIWANGLANSGHWYSGFFRQVGDFAGSFVKADANWSQANFFFLEKKWGNTLNWTAQRFLKSADWAEFTKKISETIAGAANKIAPGLGDKILTTIGAGTTASGIGLILLGAQVLWEVGKNILGKLKGFIGSIFSGKPDKTLLGSAFLVLNGVLAGIPVMLIAAFEALKLVLRKLWDTLLALLALAFTIAISVLIIGGILFSNFTTTSNLAPGVTQMMANVVCNLTGGTPTPNSPPLVSAGKCIYDFLQGNGINPLTASNAGGVNWSPLGNAAAASIIQLSATGQGVFQCVGFIAGAGAMIGKPFNPVNACSYVNHAPYGFSWTTKPTVGCFFVIGSSTCSQCGVENAPANSCGHVGIVTGVNGAIINAMDANGTRPWGMVRINAQFPTSSIAGYMCP